MGSHSAARPRRRPSSRTLADAYRNRIADVVRTEYPRVAAALGPQAFDALVIDYLARYPSTRMTAAGVHLPRFLATRQPGWLAELARLERAHVAVVAGDEPRRLARRDLGDAVALIPAHAILELTAAVDESFVGAPAAIARTVIVWRGVRGTACRAIAGDELLALHSAARGVSLDDLCAIFWTAANPLARALDVALRWIDDGLVAG